MNPCGERSVVRIRLLYLHCVLFKVLELMLYVGSGCEIRTDGYYIVLSRRIVNQSCNGATVLSLGKNSLIEQTN